MSVQTQASEAMAPALPQGISHGSIKPERPCRCCASTKGWGYRVSEKVSKDYSYLQRLLPPAGVSAEGVAEGTHFEICGKCYKYIEGKFIGEIPVEDLPLYVNHEWLDWRHEQVFKDRFQKTERDGEKLAERHGEKLAEKLPL